MVRAVDHMPLPTQNSPGAREVDEVTLAGAKRGNPRACTKLVENYEVAVFALLGRMLNPRGLGSEIEDIAQETFTRAFAALPRFDPQGPAKLSTWLLCIASRLAIREIERRRPIGEPAEPAVAGPHRRVEAAADLRRAIACLTADQQAALVLREFHGLSDAEIGEALGLEANAVKARVFRARARLRELIGKEVCDEG